MKTIAVIPAHNEAETIDTVITEVKKYVPEIVVVDDGSQDSTREKALQAGAAVVTHPLNRGVGAALRTGYRIALQKNADYIIQIDGDFQHDPRYIPSMVE